MRVKNSIARVCFFLVLSAAALAWTASAPQLINYQGRLSDGLGQPLDNGSTVDLTFAFYGVESGSTPLFLTVLQEDVLVNGGLYSALIGSGSIIPGAENDLASVFQNHRDVWMGVKVDSDPEMTPRQRITSAPYALKVDPGWLTAFFNKSDFDGDGYAKVMDGDTATTDCNDGDASINPGAEENCTDGVDNDCNGLADGMDPVCLGHVPAGCYYMGDHFNEGNSNELPVHYVCITSDMYMDVHEVTNAEYKACVDAAACTVPGDTSSDTRSPYYGNPAYDDYPVIYVSWNQATAYCSWAGKRLPTEAEWEYAARGGLEGKRYFWGDTLTGSEANYYDSGDPFDNDTSPVGYFPPNGYGLYDMAGNAWEWVNDRYYSLYYQYCVDNTIVNDPPGYFSGTNRVIRSGGWNGDSPYIRASYKFNASPTYQGYHIGFRCVRN